jgi:hypothetical protein
MTNDQRPRTARKSLSLMIAVIGAFMAIVAAFGHPDKKAAFASPAFLGGLGLVVIGTVVFFRRPAGRSG